MNKKLKEKLQMFLGLLIVGFFVISFFISLHKRNFAEPKFKVLKTTSISSPVNNTLFWYEEELEKIEFGISTYLSKEGTNFTKSLYNELEKHGMVNDEIVTMSEKATQRMIELDAYRGTEPDVFQIAEQNDYNYIFKVYITDVSWKKRSKDLESVTYRFSLYDITRKEIIWEAETTRLSEFFGGMPDNQKTINALKEKLKEAKIIK